MLWEQTETHMNQPIGNLYKCQTDKAGPFYKNWFNRKKPKKPETKKTIKPTRLGFLKMKADFFATQQLSNKNQQ